MKKQLITIAISSTLLTASMQNAIASTEENTGGENDHYIGASVGAITGALFAGPVGFIAGGVIGSLAGKNNAAVNNEITQAPPDNETQTLAAVAAQDQPPLDDGSGEAIVVAQSGEMASEIENDTIETSSAVEELLIAQINFDVFFLSGSTSVEAFYKPQIQAIARLMQQLPDVGIHLEGYSDRRGDEQKNLMLANQRLDAVRSELELAGVDSSRIRLSAFGEQRFISKPGDLEAYTFDRRVAIHFEHTTPEAETPVALVENATAP